MAARSRARLSASVALAVPMLLGLPALAVAGPATSFAAEATDTSDGPHSPSTRVPEVTSVTHRGGATISHYDLGDAEVGARPGQFRAPVRGSLVTPDAGTAPTKFVIVSHLRYPGCAGDVYAFPCKGAENRLDRGMEYLGIALAKKGYTVLIPDLAPVWIGGTLVDPYDQTSAWLKVVGRARDALASDVSGTTRRFGLDLAHRVDLSSVGLFVHSRSGYVAGPAAAAWAHGPTPLRSILAYGPAYDVPDGEGRITPAVPANVPYLALVGDADQDVPFNAQMWVGQHIEQKRSASALVATLPGLGHDAINETLSNAGSDDRLGCTPSSCPPAATHRAVLTNVAQDYFDATMRGSATSLPLTPGAVLPRRIAGLPARMLAVTNARDRLTLFDADTAKAPTTSRGSRATMCRFYPPDDPTRYADRCVDPNLGGDMIMSRVARVQLKPGGSFSVPARVTGASSVNVQIAPYGDRADKRPDSPLRVTVTTASGRRAALTMPADAGDVTANRSTVDANGTYVLGTLRIPVPVNLRSEVITGVEVSAPRGGDYALRAIEVRGRTAAAGTKSPTKPATGTQPTTTPGVHGPLVNTDHVVDVRDAGSQGAAGLTTLALLSTGIAVGFDRRGRQGQRSR